jgi:hypothetical protein
MPPKHAWSSTGRARARRPAQGPSLLGKGPRPTPGTPAYRREVRGEGRDARVARGDREAGRAGVLGAGEDLGPGREGEEFFLTRCPRLEGDRGGVADRHLVRPREHAGGTPLGTAEPLDTAGDDGLDRGARERRVAGAVRAETRR